MVTVKSTIIPPIRANILGFSPKNINTQSGLRIGSSVAIILELVAELCLIPNEKKIYPNPNWKTPIMIMYIQIVGF